MNNRWEDLAAWWLAEVEAEEAYGTDVAPLLESLLPELGGRVLDLGCGEGRVMALVSARGGTAFGCDVNETLAQRASVQGPTIVARAPELGFLRSGVFTAVVAVLVLEHIQALGRLFAEAARVCRPDGVLVAVLNHPLYTAPGSAPIVDPDDGELYWRWGSYLSCGTTREPAGEGFVTFHHRPLGVVLNAAARAAWSLEQMEERAVSVGPPALGSQEQVPRLLGARWRLRSSRDGIGQAR